MLNIIKKTLVELENNSDKMTDKELKRLEKLKIYFEKNNYITNKELQDLLEVSESTAKRFLNKLVDREILRAEGERKARKYYCKG
ncbi:winged helix-turn-helix transcriptional regulator [Fusobacterium russii]|uniref:winged helix-turn-helix transcriptional regulator n=1 Tax=Fusobacterium russii TaxID=854 RepID=UPI0004783024|nr:winged helix-turn-helix transcriptional regulator [Fusobacterium russii]